jgi:RNA polymerase sigma factor (sigma-70 family)
MLMVDGKLTAVVRQLRALAAGPAQPTATDGELLRAFLAAHDQDAFATILQRHGPMVLAACRRVLPRLQDAEDVLQATFLLLARQGGSIREDQSVASWLHGVAYRMAKNARRAAVRRRKHETAATTSQPDNPAWTVAWREVQLVLDDEIQRLPAIYREPFILCCLEHRSAAEVAHSLRQKEGTVWSRVARAKKRLQVRLAQRGIALSALLAALAVSPNTARAGLALGLASTTLRAATALTARHGPWEHLVSKQVAALVQGAKESMSITTLKWATAVLLTAGILGAALGLSGNLGAETPDSMLPSVKLLSPTLVGPAVVADEPQAPQPNQASVVISGRVLDPDAHPVQGAKIYWWSHGAKTGEGKGDPAVQAVTGADGQFHFKFAPLQKDAGGLLLAKAKGFGADWIDLPTLDKTAELTLQLAKDDVPVVGRILNLEGKAIPGATVKVVRIAKGTTKKDVPVWVDETAQWLTTHHYGHEFGLSVLPPTLIDIITTTTDKDGRFRLTGLGRDRVFVLDVSGPGIERRLIWAVTLPQMPNALAGGTVGLYGATFDHFAGPSRLVSGTVTDAETGKPVPGVRVTGRVPKMGPVGDWEAEATTDDKGNYQLNGLPKDSQYAITAAMRDGGTYLPQEKVVADAEGLKPLQVHLALRPGTLVQGKFLDEKTGKPIRGHVSYHPLPGNDYFQNLVTDKIGIMLRTSIPVAEDGTFKLVVPAGLGVICGVADNHDYLPAPIAKEDAQQGVGSYRTVAFEEMHGMSKVAGHAYRVIQPGQKAEILKFDLKAESTRAAAGTVVGPDGQALAGVRGADLSQRKKGTWDALDPWIQVAVDAQTGKFTATGLHPRRSQLLLFFQPERKLAGHIEIPIETQGMLTVKLQPCGSLKGRLVTEDGLPPESPALILYCVAPDGERYAFFREQRFIPSITIEKDGSFHIEGLPAGLKLVIEILARSDQPGLTQMRGVVRELTDVEVQAGQSKDLGKVVIKAVAQK